jgi:hypothetical protein
VGHLPRRAPRQPLPRASAVERPGDEQRLTKQPRETLPVGVEAEGIDAVQILRDVAREDRDEERRGAEPDGDPLRRQCDETRADRELHDTGQGDRGVLRQRQRLRDLRDELLARPRQVADAGEEQHRAERDARDGPRGGQGRSRIEQGRAGHPAMLAGLRATQDQPTQPLDAVVIRDTAGW